MVMIGVRMMAEDKIHEVNGNVPRNIHLTSAFYVMDNYYNFKGAC
jgi:predicted tellurium resistance membrane protein TerC